MRSGADLLGHAAPGDIGVLEKNFGIISEILRVSPIRRWLVATR